MTQQRKRKSFYLWLAIAMSCTALVGFSFTYLGPLFQGVYPRVSPIVHVHGWTYFAWYLLLLPQAGLIQAGRVTTHRTLGLASTVLGILMITVGLIVSTVRIDMAQGPNVDPFWELMGVPIFSIWVLFTVFYVAAIHLRRRVADHKRLIMLVSAVALAAAPFRIMVKIFGFEEWVAVVRCRAPVLFVFAAMIYDHKDARDSPSVSVGSSGDDWAPWRGVSSLRNAQRRDRERGARLGRSLLDALLDPKRDSFSLALP